MKSWCLESRLRVLRILRAAENRFGWGLMVVGNGSNAARDQKIQSSVKIETGGILLLASIGTCLNNFDCKQKAVKYP
jgi:hypothetical protein